MYVCFYSPIQMLADLPGARGAHLRPARPAADGVAEPLALRVGDVVEVALGVGRLVVDRGRDDPVPDRQDAHQ